MKCKMIIVPILVFVILLFPVALAAGGGGGGGGYGGGSGGGSKRTSYSDLECKENGAISFTRDTEWKNITVQREKDGVILSDIHGDWINEVFTSDEAIFVRPGTYHVLDPLYGNKKVECPGLGFSCALARIQVNQCTFAAGVVHAEVELVNSTPQEVKFEFTRPGTQKTLKYEKESHSTELNTLRITKKDSTTYLLDAENVPEVAKFQVSIPQCVGKYYLYSQEVECGNPSSGARTTGKREKKGQKMKCGGYLSIEDRVKCRINLPEEEKGEYDNFFPEECRTWTDQDACVDVYRTVQPCWKNVDSPSRISCLRQKVGVLDVKAQKRVCAERTGEERTACENKLRKDVYTLAKLRLYNLEEAAEELEEEGKITEEELIDFVVKMEQSKMTFNEATTKQQRKEVIVQAQRYWLELVRKVRA